MHNVLNKDQNDYVSKL